MQFFKTYKSEYGVTEVLEIDDFMPYEDLADIENPKLRLINKYCELLAGEIDKALARKA